MKTFLLILLSVLPLVEIPILIAKIREKCKKQEGNSYDQIEIKQHNEIPKIRQHNEANIKESDLPLLLEVLGQQFMDDCYLTSISCPSKQYSCQCPSCGMKDEDLVWVEYRSPNWTWSYLCGREGYMVFCPTCKKCVNNILTLMN